MRQSHCVPAVWRKQPLCVSVMWWKQSRCVPVVWRKPYCVPAVWWKQSHCVLSLRSELEWAYCVLEQSNDSVLRLCPINIYFVV